MAAYYSLLSRAVANLPKTSPPTARRAIYDRARKALNNQLRSLRPPLPETDIAREETALEAAVSRIEAEYDPAAAAAPLAMAGAAEAPRPSPPAPPAVRPQAPRPVVAPPPPRPVLPPPPPAAAAPKPAVAKKPDAPLEAKRPTLPRIDESAPIVPVAPRDEVVAESKAPPVGPQARVAAEQTVDAPPLPAAKPEPPRGPEPARPMAPRKEAVRRGYGGWKWAIIGIVLGLVAAVAVTAFLMRSHRPQELAIGKPSTPSGAPEPAQTPADGPKIAQRITGAGSVSAQAADTPGTADIGSPTPSPAPTALASTGSQVSTAATQGPASAAAPQPGSPRAAMLMATPQELQKPTVAEGSVVWSSVAPGQGQGGGPGVRAEITIPDLKLHASIVLRKNVDASLPASHTIDVRFTFDPNGPLKGIKDIGVPQMRRDDTPNPIPLLGVRVPIDETYFLVGLNQAAADVQHNVDAIAGGGWFDFPMLLPDGRVAKLTFEKGADGEKIIASALAAWK